MDTNKAYLSQDPAIAMILQKLQETSNDEESTEETPSVNEDSETTDDLTNKKEDVENTEEQDNDNQSEDEEFVEEDIHCDACLEKYLLPWITLEDRDNDVLHYAVFNGDTLIYKDADPKSSTDDIAKLKMSSDYACEIDYYKNNQYVLFVKQDKKDSSQNTAHYTVYTDLGVIEFDAAADKLTEDKDLNNWFEKLCNYTELKDVQYKEYKLKTAQKLNSSDNCNTNISSIKEFKYNIITMQVSGLISLDSIYNEDDHYKLHIKLKDEFKFIPLVRFLKCLKHYAESENKSFDNFKLYLSNHFDLI